MTILSTTLLVLLAALAAAALFRNFKSTAALAQSKARATADREAMLRESSALQARIQAMQTELVALNSRLLESESQKSALKASLRLMENERARNDEMLRSQFANLATEILQRNSADFKAQSEERLGQLLNPLKENLEGFKKTVAETYANEARERFSLEKAIASLVNVNDTISREARELTQALKGNNSVQGEWGEMVLESILEKSGLVKDEEYFVQSTADADGNTMLKEDGGALRPDVVVKYPDGRCVIIDSKVSLKAYLEYANTDDRTIRKNAGDRHVLSVKSHVDKLAKKKYQEFIGSDQLDFVMMFIPNEPAYMAAMRIDSALWQYAYDRNVLIVSPTHLVSGLRLIAQLWSRDKVTKNAIRIAEEAGKMYDKFADFVNDMDRMDKALASARKAHTDAMTKLTTGTGSLRKRASDLKALGIKASKQLKLTSPDTADEEE
ncbi:MAG: DNA recombination protein RmuC [Muribaculaceae bacterium]|nr:DNA recombination protein RmuC [Muribaculaceae bacterium]